MNTLIKVFTVSLLEMARVYDHLIFNKRESMKVHRTCWIDAFIFFVLKEGLGNRKDFSLQF